MKNEETPKMRAETKTLLESHRRAFHEAAWPRFLSIVTHDIVHDINQGRRDAGAIALGLITERIANCYQEKVHDLQIFISDDSTKAEIECIADGIYKTTWNR